MTAQLSAEIARLGARRAAAEIGAYFNVVGISFASDGEGVQINITTANRHQPGWRALSDEQRGDVADRLALVWLDTTVVCVNPDCGETSDLDELEERTHQQWRCPCCGWWVDRTDAALSP